MNANGNGAGMPAQTQINPLEAAGFALQFLARVPHTLAERAAFDVATALLQAISEGRALVSAPPSRAALEAAAPPPA